MSYIKQECAIKIIEAIHIEEVIGKFVDLKKSGSQFKGMSPFSNERTGSFMVSPVKQIYKCFSSGKGGNAINFIMDHKGMSYPEALKFVAEMYSIPLEYEKQEFSEQKVKQLEEKEQLRKVLTLSHQLYQKEFAKLEDNHPAKLEVIGKRLYDQDTIIEWGIGFAPSNFLYDKLASSGYTNEGKALGVIKTSEERQNLYDQYSERVIYPIHDQNGLLIGFAGRNCASVAKKSKWINPDVNTNNKLYEKEKVLYGLHKAKQAIRKYGEVFITEGYNDVIALHRYGCLNTVSLSGTAVSEYQINQLKKLCDKVVFVMDPDRAGKEAVLKYLPKFIKFGFRTEVITLDFDPDDYVRQYVKIIENLGGLLPIFNKTGLRKDGFTVLINNLVKSDYQHLEEEIEIEKGFLQDAISEFENTKVVLNNEIIDIENQSADAKVKLKNAVVKSENYVQIQSELEQLKALSISKKAELKSNKSSVVELGKEKIRKLEDDFKIVYKNADLVRSAGAKEICSVLAYVTDDSFSEIYFEWLHKESKISKPTLTKWIKESKIDKPAEIAIYDFETQYILPKDVTLPLNDLMPSIKHYGLFMCNNQIYMQLPEADDKKVYFVSKSNFEIAVLQHMNDEKYPTKLIRVKNIHNKEVIFDTLSENLNTPQAFDNTITGHGNYNFLGNRADLLRLRSFLFDTMGNGRKIDVLGWQPDGSFWAWNNSITYEDGSELEVDSNGIFVDKDTHYYIPSANKIHKFATNKFKAQKKFKVISSPVSFEVYSSKVYKVHREHAISGLLFGISSLFQDIAVDENGNFPIFFLYGPGGSGKDELAYIIQSFTGLPQTPINLEGGASTLKAKIIELAQFKNGISQLSEYKRGDKNLDGTLKAIWDRNGYKRGSIESRIAIDTVDIESSVILTGNDYPNVEPLIIRMIWNEMDKTVFSAAEMQEFDELNDMTEKGISGYSNRIMKYRSVYKKNFSKNYRLWKKILQEFFPEVKGRIISNLSVLATTYQFLRDDTDIILPFEQNDMIAHFRKQIGNQMAKIQSSSIMVRFWDCFIVSLRGNKEERIQAGHITNVEQDTLYIQWTHVFAKIERQWWIQYHETAPSKSLVKDELLKSGLLIKELSEHNYSSGRNGSRSSAYAINLQALSENVRVDIIGSIVYQLNEGTLWKDEQEQKLLNAKDKALNAIQTAIPIKFDEKENSDVPF